MRLCRLLSSFHEGLDGSDLGRDRVQRCRIFNSFQEDPHQKFFFQGFFPSNSASKMGNCIIVDIANYRMLLYTYQLHAPLPHLRDWVGQ